MPAPVLTIPELCDEIIGFISHRLSLESVALVCRTFVASAQQKLFRKITIRDGGIFTGSDGATKDRTVITGAVVAGYLSELLTSSPHLLVYIKELDVDSRHTGCFAILSGIQWTHLRTIFFRHVSRIPGLARPSMETLASIPSLRKLEIWDNGWGTDEERLERLQWIIMSCASGLESLTLFGYWIDAAPPSNPNQTHSVRHDRPKLRELSLSFCAGVTGLLWQAFDFTDIPFIRCEASWSPEVELFMREIGGSVKNIAVAPRDRELFHIPIKDYFPALECITSTALPCAARVFDDDEVPPDTSNPPAAPLISMVRLLPPDSMLTRIVIQTEVDHLEMESFQTYVPELETVVITRLPALQSVEIQIYPSWQHVYQDTGFDWPYKKVVTQARKVFPRIAEKNLLFVRLR